MSSLDWEAFERLPGAPDTNFERLCRAAIRRTYGRYGDFNALANQPGVEFHLRLAVECSLGRPGDRFGWQCRWYDLPGGAKLGSARRGKIEEAIATTQRHLPDLNQWVLWTRRPLAADDQRWFSSLSAPFRLVQWTATEVEEHLTGEAAVFRATFFGDLVLTPISLADQHRRSIAPIARRWLPDAHQPVRAERELRRMLGDTDAWQDLGDAISQLYSDTAAAERDMAGLTGSLAASATEAIGYTRSVAAALEGVKTYLGQGDFDALPRLLAEGPVRPCPPIASLPRGLRVARHRSAPTMNNALAAARHARGLLEALANAIDNRLIAVTAEAGCGKTELAAQLTAPHADRPAGILLHGRDLRAGDSLDTLAGRVVIQGVPVRSMEALVASVAAAGLRSGHRLPVVIDGLNEAEDPRDWKRELASLAEILRPYPHILVICTLRPAFAEEALSDSIPRLEIPGFERDTAEAVRRYFAYYRIDAADADLPWDLLAHPLTLRLFCEVTNLSRLREVGVEAMPGSLTDLFDRYLQQAVERIAELAPGAHRYYKADIRHALIRIGILLWDRKTRQLASDELRRELGDEGRPWDECLVRALEQDGVLVRDPRNAETTDQQVSVVFDRLAGHLIATALLERHGREGFEQLLREPGTSAALGGAGSARHTLGDDILLGLVGLTPRRFQGEQVWRMVEEPIRSVALRGTARLDGASIDAATVEELAALAVRPEEGRAGLFPRLMETRGVVGHPLNSDFLDRVLRSMAVADRDLHWTEWIRRNEDALSDDIGRLEGKWRTSDHRTAADRLRARWVAWLLTSTIQLLRDRATRALYWFGRGDPTGLFELTLDTLALDDPSVSERTMAASFGVVMAHQLPDGRFAGALRTFLAGLRDRLLGSTATRPTNHWLIRLHAQGAWDLAHTYYRESTPEDVLPEGPLEFAPGPYVEPISTDDSRAGQVERTLHMDFENYTIGRLVANRLNYDRHHPDHRAAVEHVRGMIWSLGWRESSFSAVDRAIAENERYRRGGGQVDRYGKKYGWIGFYTRAGLLADALLLPDGDRLSDLGIDPSFPDPPPSAPIGLPLWAAPTPESDLDWLRSGYIGVPDDFLYRGELEGESGPWVAAYAWLTAEDETTGREVSVRLIAFLVSDEHADKLANELLEGEESDDRDGDLPSDSYTFAGEIPWSQAFGQSHNDASEESWRDSADENSTAYGEIEILAHTYAWESYHSPLNEAGSVLVPSRAFSTTLDLRGVPQSFDQTEANGKRAARSYQAPSGFTGRVLYLREDLLKRYAAGRRLMIGISGQRRLNWQAGIPHSEIRDIHDSGQTEWHMVRRGEELFRVPTENE